MVPLRQWGFRQCLPFCLTTIRGKHCLHPITVMGVVDTFGHSNQDFNPEFPIQFKNVFSTKKLKKEKEITQELNSKPLFNILLQSQSIVYARR